MCGEEGSVEESGGISGVMRIFLTGVVVTWLYVFVKMHILTVHFTKVNFSICKLHLNEIHGKTKASEGGTLSKGLKHTLGLAPEPICTAAQAWL